MLLHIAKGDAYGAGFEYATPEYVAQLNDLTAFVENKRHPIGKGRYTDDLQQTLPLAELIISGQEWTRENIANGFVNAFKRDPRPGYAGGYYAFLQSVSDGEEFLQKIKPNSDKSGGAMRGTVVGLFPEIERVKELAELQASLTHNTRGGIDAALVAALATHYFAYGLGKKSALGAFLEKHVPGTRWSEPWTGFVGEKGVMSAHAAVSAIMEGASMADVLKRCIAFTGDVDTVAAIAMGAAAHSSELVDDLPAWMDEQLENGQYGRDYLKVQDHLLRVRLDEFRSR